MPTFDDDSDGGEELSDAEYPDARDLSGEDDDETDPCPSCGRPIYHDAAVCPYCGEPITPGMTGARKSLLYILIAAIAVLAMLWLTMRG